MDELVKARLTVTNDGDVVTVAFTRGEAQVLLRFPAGGDMQAAHDLSVLLDNIDPLIDSANLELEAAVLRQEMTAE